MNNANSPGVGPGRGDDSAHNLPYGVGGDSGDRHAAGPSSSSARPARRAASGNLPVPRSASTELPNARWRTSAAQSTNLRLTRAARFFELLTDDGYHGKLEVGEQDKWVKRQLDTMYAGHHITQRAIEYINEAGRPGTDHIHTGWSALAGDTARAARAVRQHFGDTRCVVLGLFGRRPHHDRRAAQFDAADVIALPEGDPHAVQQFVEALDYLSASQPRPGARWPKRLVVTNFPFYRPFFVGAFGRPPRGEAEHDFYRRAIESHIGGAGKRVEVVLADALERVPTVASGEAHSVGKARTLAEHAARPISVSTLFFGSTKEVKAYHWNQALGKRGIEVPSLIQVVDELGEPPERHRSYVTNARGLPAPYGENSGKAESFIATIRRVLARTRRMSADDAHALTRDEFLGKLRDSFGIDVSRGDKLTFLVDDRGIEFAHWQQLKPYFPTDLRREIFAEIDRRVGHDPDRGIRGQDYALQPVPGVESTWWFNAAGGVGALLSHFEDAYARYAADHDEPLEPRMRSVCAATLVEMDLSASDAPVRVRNYAGTTEYLFRRPGPGDDPDDSYSWCVPLGEGERADVRSVARRIAEREEGAYEAELPWMKVIDAMTAAGIEFERRSDVSRVPDYRVEVLGVRDGAKRASRYQAEVRALVASTHTERAASPARGVLPTASAQATGEEPFDPYAIERQMHGHDALVFAGTPESIGGRTEMLYALFSALVAKNMHPEHKGKLLLVNESDSGVLAARRISGTLLAHGLSEDWRLLAQPFADETQLQAALREHWAGYRRIRGTLDIVPDDFDVRAGLDACKDARGMARGERWPAVAVWCSARSVVAAWQNEAHVVADVLANRRVDLLYGGGTKGLMFEVADRHRQIANERGTGARVAGISTPIVIGKETTTGELPRWLDVGHNAPDIVRRMEMMLSADHFVVLKGGDGTVQEVAMAIGLKAAGAPLMRGKRIVILNAPAPGGSRVYDDLIAFYGPLDASANRQLREGRERLRDELDVRVLESSGAQLAADVARELGIAHR